jgi:hypothetical protein
MSTYSNTIICYGFRVEGEFQPGLRGQDVIYYRDTNGTYLISLEDYYKIGSDNPVITDEDMAKGFMTPSEVAIIMEVYEILLTPTDDVIAYFQEIATKNNIDLDQIKYWIVEYNCEDAYPPYMRREFIKRLPIQSA